MDTFDNKSFPLSSRAWRATALAVLFFASGFANAAEKAGSPSNKKSAAAHVAELSAPQNLEQPRKANEVASIKTLSDALCSAYEKNASILAARAEVNASAEEVAKALSEWRPEIDMIARQSNSSSRHKKLQTLPGIERRAPETGIHDESSLGLELRQNIYSGGGTSARIDYAINKFVSYCYVLIEKEQELFVKVIDAFLNVIIAQEFLAADKRNEEHLNKLLEQTRVKFEVGDQTISDLKAAEAKVLDARMRISSDIAEIDSTTAHLKDITGNSSLAYNLETPKPFEYKVDSLEKFVAQASRSFPELIALMFNEKAALASVANATSQFLPKVDLSAGLRRNKSFAQENHGRVNGIDRREYHNDGSVGVTLSVPIYKQGLTNAAHREATQQLHKARLERAQKVRDVAHLCAKNLSHYEAAVRNVDIAKASLDANKVSLDQAEKQYEFGERGFAETVQYQTYWIDSLKQLIKATSDLVRASYNLPYMVGKLRPKTLALKISEYNPYVYYDKNHASWFDLGSDEYFGEKIAKFNTEFDDFERHSAKNIARTTQQPENKSVKPNSSNKPSK
ncbi:TolC family protein [Candidatus Hydrogenosomobacter endosymbioticus]|uniref:Type I secretion protein TolC n=1 Tax=Candidatus Hydrogenosomobacter endosymbioticus TaxID=2558174 RepID=A0ABM7V8J8_9PROT|nr:TolC family protein [Candidatus Hydrogenosomobacter endosymbioticus]BDB96104.1 type I secretion protein TolC [Candidatus Hydrogenosomobacter endosymbioticus]